MNVNNLPREISLINLQNVMHLRMQESASEELARDKTGNILYIFHSFRIGRSLAREICVQVGARWSVESAVSIFITVLCSAGSNSQDQPETSRLSLRVVTACAVIHTQTHTCTDMVRFRARGMLQHALYRERHVQAGRGAGVHHRVMLHRGILIRVGRVGVCDVILHNN